MDEDDARTSYTVYTRSAEKAHDTTVDDENASQHVTSVLVTVLCNQPEASASELVTTSHVTCYETSSFCLEYKDYSEAGRCWYVGL